MPKQESEPTGLTFQAKLTCNGKPMSAEEFIELAKQNNAYHPVDNIDETRQEFLKHHQLRFDWLGSPYIVDPHNPIQRGLDTIHTAFCFGTMFYLGFFLLLYGGFAAIIFMVLFPKIYSVTDMIIMTIIAVLFIFWKLTHRKSPVD
jgi:hypothetical protein